MTLCQTLLLDFDTEMKATRTLLERVPLSNYKPHEKSMALDYLATHVADLPSWFAFALESELLHLPAGFKMEVMTSTEALLDLFDKSVVKGRAAIDKATDEEMQKNWTFKYADIFSMTEPRPQVVRSFLNHFVHHRAQLGVYLRLLNIPIPGFYGPSADDKWS
ncbi:MAG: damage-inducible protein DinB [Acidobacteria bacterium]|nr:damage-inducible protein DinB [Acidobacteriota bacterium]